MLNGSRRTRTNDSKLGILWRCAAVSFAGFIGVSNAGFAQCRFPVTAHEPAITYRFHPEATPAGLVLHVTFSFRTSADGTETLVLPTHWAGETLHAVTNLRAVSRGASLRKARTQTRGSSALPSTVPSSLRTISKRIGMGRW